MGRSHWGWIVRRALVALWLCGLAAGAFAQSKPTLSMVVSRAVATEGTTMPVNIQLVLDRPAPAGGVCIDIDLAGGEARPGEDFNTAISVPSIPEGASMATLPIMIVDDDASESDESVRIVLRPSECYQLGPEREFILLIRDDDDDAGSLQDRLQTIVQNAPDPLVASQLAQLGELCATNRPPPGSELDRRCQLLRLALRDPAAAQQLIASLRGVLGEEVSSQRRGFRMLAGTQLGAIGRRLEAVRGGGGAGVALVDSGLQSRHGFLPLAANVAEDGGLLGRGIGLFASAVFGSGERDSTDLENGYDSDTDIFLVGIDKRFDAEWVLGLAYAQTRSDAELSDDAGDIGLRMRALSLYASRSFEHGWIDGSLGWGRGEVRQSRVARFAGATDEESFSSVDVLRGTPDADQLTATLSAGRDWQRGNASFGPRLEAEYARFVIDGFDEVAVQGSDAFAVSLQEQTIRSLLIRAGVGAQWAISTRHGVLLPQLDLYWVNQLEDEAATLRGSFLNDPSGRLFELPTEGVDSSFGEVSASLGMQFIGGWSGYVSYRRLFGFAHTEQDYWSLGVRAEF